MLALLVAILSDEQDFNENYNPTNVDESFLERIEDTGLNSLTNRLNNSRLNATELSYHTMETRQVTQVLPAQPIQTFHVPIDPQTIVIQRSSSEASVASTESLVPCEICNKKLTKRGMTKYKNSKHATAQ